MPPSYPSWEWESEMSIRFFAPTKRVVHKILEDSNEDENLHKKAAGTILYNQVKRLAKLLSRHQIRVESITPNELEVVMFLESPPSPPPKPNPPPNPSPIEGRKKLDAYRPQLDTIEEVPEEHTPRLVAKLEESLLEEWTSPYEHIPARKRYAIYAG